MILLDTHLWLWWVNDPDKIPAEFVRVLIQEANSGGLSISAISCWEVAMLAARGRVTLPLDVRDWVAQALAPSGITALDVIPAIAIEANLLPGNFHADPADRLIVATARALNLRLATLDGLIRRYPNVPLVQE